MIFTFVIVLPLAALCLTWFLHGSKPWMTFMAILTAAWMLVALLVATGTLQGLLVGAVLMVLSIPFSAAAAIRFAPIAEVTPAQQTYRAYDSLDPASKERLHTLAVGGCKIGLKGLAAHLRGKNHPILGRMAGEASKLL